jgi:hypothetical protein
MTVGTVTTRSPGTPGTGRSPTASDSPRLPPLAPPHPVIRKIGRRASLRPPSKRSTRVDMYRWRIGYGSRPAPALIPLAVLVLAGSLLFVLASQQPRVVTFRGGQGRAACGGSGYGEPAGASRPREPPRGAEREAEGLRPSNLIRVMPAKGVSIVSARTELVVVGGGVVGLAITRQAARADPERMAVAMRHAVVAGRCAWLAGRIPRRWHAQASSPVDGLLERR